ncbi:Phophatidylserine decarboxylase-domain-containing protein [Delphinella strobiligena]|nr:Phophatidylserine decarboxylase-domain-containing protein [Delphinella strobiligena]
MGHHYERQKNVPKEHHVHRVGDWLPTDHRVHKEWLDGVVDHVEKNPKELHPVLKEFKQLIETNSRIYMLITAMFDEIPQKKPYVQNPEGHKQIRDYHQFLKVLNHILSIAPHWNDNSEKVGMVGLPINALLDWPMGTPSGYALFLDPEMNKMWKKILDAWGEFLTSPESCEPALGDGPKGWFNKTGITDLGVVANKAGGTENTFEELFHCDATKPYHGFKSWDDFFTRHFKFDEGVRPVASPDDDNVIANACESKPYNVQRDVKIRDKFWLKGQPYSLDDMLAHDPLAEKFVGGTVYQAFLSALSYHRWHAPVSGKVVKQYVAEGTYYSEPLWEGIGESGVEDINMSGQTVSQGYLTSVATRGVVFIEADNPAIGLMAFIGVGMTEVSTCDITVKEGQHIKKGEEIGMFHFGGSTHVLIFRKGVNVQGFPEPGRDSNFPVRAAVAHIEK